MDDIITLEEKSFVAPSGVTYTVGDRVVFVGHYVNHIKSLEVGFTGEEIGIIDSYIEKDRGSIMALVFFDYEHLKVKHYCEMLDRFMFIQ